MAHRTDSYPESEWRSWVRAELNLILTMVLVIAISFGVVTLILGHRVDSLTRRMDRSTTTTTQVQP